MENIIYKKIFNFDYSQSGSVVIVVALSVIALLTVAAFVIDISVWRKKQIAERGEARPWQQGQ